MCRVCPVADAIFATCGKIVRAGQVDRNAERLAGLQDDQFVGSRRAPLYDGPQVLHRQAVARDAEQRQFKLLTGDEPVGDRNRILSRIHEHDVHPHAFADGHEGLGRLQLNLDVVRDAVDVDLVHEFALRELGHHREGACHQPPLQLHCAKSPGCVEST